MVFFPQSLNNSRLTEVTNRVTVIAAAVLHRVIENRSIPNAEEESTVLAVVVTIRAELQKLQ
jgi:hypothetical protein